MVLAIKDVRINEISYSKYQACQDEKIIDPFLEIAP